MGRKDKNRHYLCLWVLLTIESIVGTQTTSAIDSLNLADTSEATWNTVLETFADKIKSSKCSSSCFKHGTCNEELARCDCVKGRTGNDCSEELPTAELDAMCKEQFYPKVSECLRFEQPCLNACNRRGLCYHGFCKCFPGYFGADCSLSMDDEGKPQLLSDQGYLTRSKRPWVYVYELPPVYTTWGNTRRMDRPIHILFWQRLLSSGARVADPAQADWFFIPMRMRSHRDSNMYVRAIDYINTTWPHFQKLHGGERHIMIHSGDVGTQELGTSTKRVLPNMTWLTHWGLHEDNEMSSWRASHRPDKDIVIPVYISPHHFAKFGMDRSPSHPKAPATVRSNNFFFAGRICGDRHEPKMDGSWPCSDRSGGYSGGVRQKVFYHHYNRTGFLVATRVKNYDQLLAGSKFCLAPTGGGHGQRQILVSFMGCLPVTIGDDIFQPFEPEIDWSRFAVQPTESQIPTLHQLLADIGDEQVAQMQRALRCAAQHFVWSSVTGGFMGETGAFDAFETLLEVLRVKAKFPEATPMEYADMDKDFRVFMNCGADEMGGAPNEDWLRSRGPSFTTSLTTNPLCSHSRYDGREPPCYRCMRGQSNTHGVPGGFMCCGDPGKLGTCPRVWD